MAEWPWPVGTYVTCRYAGDDLPLRKSCERHIWEIVSEVRRQEFTMDSTGEHVVLLSQAARCLICGGPPTPMVDAIFFWKKADAFDVAGAFGEIAATIQWCEETKAKLEAWWLNGGEAPVGALRDLG